MMRWVLCLLYLLVTPLWADDLRPASLLIEPVGEDVYDVSWTLPIQKGRTPGFSIVLDERTILHAPVKRHVIDNTVVERWQVQRPGGLAGLAVRVEGLDTSYTDVLLRIRDDEGRVATAVLAASQPVFVLTADARETPARDYLWLGIEHILIGLDHLLFVACLVYLSGTARKLLWTVTGFTLAHSITLFLAALELVRVAIPPVEAAIALSIVLLAREILVNDPRSLSVRYPVLVASSFGLLHGFGFASVLSDIGLPASGTVWALLLFNLGVEIGQLLFVGVLLLLAHLLASRLALLSPATLRLAAGYLAGSVATYWFIGRLAAF